MPIMPAIATATRGVATHMARHLRTNQLYKIIGEGRDVVNPHRQVVIYAQFNTTRLQGVGVEGGGQGVDTELPPGSIWVRDKDEFDRKFRRYIVS